MTWFVILCAVLVAAAVGLIARPLLRKRENEVSSRLSAVAFAVSVPLLATLLYVTQSNWNWDRAATMAAQSQDAAKMVASLEQRLASQPNDLQGWLMLGRSYLALEKAPRAVDAYQKAFDLSAGQNTEAALGLGEALVLTDQATLGGRAGQLFESVLAREPMNTTALWYGTIAALAAGKLDVARQRIQSMLVQNPPPQVRDILQRQLQDIDQQLGKTPVDKSQGEATPSALAGGTRSITVDVSLAANLKGKADPQSAVFVLARGGPGPPLAVTRRVVADLPLQVTLSDADAMMPGRNLSSVQEITVVARISKSGAPTAQSGDLYGESVHTFKKDANAVSIVIGRAVP